MKSTLAYYILYTNAERNGARGVYVSLEQDGPSLLGQMRSLGMDKDIVRSRVRVLDIGQIRQNIDDFGVKMGWVDIVLDKVEGVINEGGCDLLAIDSLDVFEIISGVQNPRKELFAFFNHLKKKKITVLLISEISKGGTRYSSRKESFLADSIFYLRVHEKNEIDFRPRIRCVKMRGTRHEKAYYELHLDQKGFSVSKVID